MEPNIRELRRLVVAKFRGNKSAFARELKVDRGQMSKILKNGSGAGAQFFGALYVYCENENLKFDDYIILPYHVK